LPGLSVAAGAAVVCLTGVLVCARAEDDMALVCVRAGRFPSLDDSKNGIRRVRVRGVECSDNGDNQLRDDWCWGSEWVAGCWRMRQLGRKKNRGSCLNMVSKVAGRSLGCARLCAVVRWAMGLPSVACGCLGCEQNRRPAIWREVNIANSRRATAPMHIHSMCLQRHCLTKGGDRLYGGVHSKRKTRPLPQLLRHPHFGRSSPSSPAFVSMPLRCKETSDPTWTS
jgi:hypothetical protein